MSKVPDFDLYEALDLTRNATAQQVKESYRRLALLNHPDKNPGDDKATERFQRISTAYEILSDATRREKYDGPAALSPGIPKSSPGHHKDESRDPGNSNYGHGWRYGAENSMRQSFHDESLAEFKRRRDAQQAAHAAALGEDDKIRRRKEATRKAHELQKRRREEEDEKRRKEEEEAEAKRQAKFDAEKAAEEEKQESKDRTEKEKIAIEKLWSDLKVTTTAAKQSTCPHSNFWPKERQKRKFKCGSCDKKSSILAYKCPYCGLLSCQLCLSKLKA